METDIKKATKKFIGKKIQDVLIGRERISIRFFDGEIQEFYVSGGCCSASWIEHWDMPRNLLGVAFLGYDQNDMPDPEDQTDFKGVHVGSGIVQAYQSVFHTSTGDITIEYRNSSSGYYGGYLVAIV